MIPEDQLARMNKATQLAVEKDEISKRWQAFNKVNGTLSWFEIQVLETLTKTYWSQGGTVKNFIEPYMIPYYLDLAQKAKPLLEQLWNLTFAPHEQ